MSFAKRREPVTLVRSPTLTNSDSGVMVSGSRPDRRVHGAGVGTSRGARPAAAAAMARMWSGVVPQQPPTKLSERLSMSWLQDAGGLGWLLVVAPERVGQARVGIARHEHVRDARQLLEIRPQLLRAERAVEADAQWSGVPDARPEGLHRLARERPAGGVRDGAADRSPGRGSPARRTALSTAKMAALALRVSKMVSMSSMSAPPWTRPRPAMR